MSQLILSMIYLAKCTSKSIQKLIYSWIPEYSYTRPNRNIAISNRNKNALSAHFKQQTMFITWAYCVLCFTLVHMSIFAKPHTNYIPHAYPNYSQNDHFYRVYNCFFVSNETHVVNCYFPGC